MIAVYISASLVTLLAIAGAAVYCYRVTRLVFQTQSADNRDLRDRLFISRGQPPTQVDVAARYEAREQRQQVKPVKPPPGPLERKVAEWTKTDRAAAEKIM